MNYNINNLNPYDFEGLVQALAKKILGNGVTSFGSGTDGGREATFSGTAPYPSATSTWDGYWVIQAKFKSAITDSNEADFTWVKSQLTTELEKYKNRKTKVRHPDNYLFFTNVKLSAKPQTGGLDKANALEREYEKKYQIKHVKIISYDDIHDLINLNRDIAISYAPFILPGDILSHLLDLLNTNRKRKTRILEFVNRYLEVEFIEDSQSKLDHAGKLTSDKVNLEKVFIDLYVAPNDTANVNSLKVVSSIITYGNQIIKNTGNPNRFVLVAGPGYGKSTVTQFIAQIHRAYFLRNHDKCQNAEFIDSFIVDYQALIKLEPKWIRLPIRISLKEYAGWISGKDINKTIIDYVAFLINRKSNGDLTNAEVEQLFETLPGFFVFDGLDEVPASSNREKVLSEINFFTDIILRRINSDSIIIATTRPQGYSKEFDNTQYQHLYIQDLAQKDCLLYLNKLLANIVDNRSERENKLEILKVALSHKEISRLMKTPLQASIMAILVNSGGEPPRNKFDLFTEYYNTILKRERQRNISKILSEKQRYIDEIHNKLGFYLQATSEKSTNASATISTLEFEEMIREYLLIKGQEKEVIDEYSIEILKVATDRLVFISEIEDAKIGFVIRSLQEYFAAKGYIHNVRDEVIKDRINKIIRSAYWNNTLLFAIGYLAKNKDYLIDVVESLCNELNGSSNNFGETNIETACRIGSWISLDILNEGIFSDAPIIENKFGNLLEPLFELAPSKEHENLCKLPERLINNWVIKYIQSNIETNKNKNTSYLLCVYLIKNGFNVKDFFLRYWPNNVSEQIYIIQLFISNNVLPVWIAEKLIRFLPKISPEVLFSLFTKSNEYEFLYFFCQNANNDSLAIRYIIEFLFIESAMQFTPIDTVKCYEYLGLKLPDGRSRHIIFFEELKLNLVEGLDNEVLKTKIEITEEIISIKNFAKQYKADLVIYLIEFLTQPTVDGFLYLNTYIDSLEDGHKQYIVTKLLRVNSFFHCVYSKKDFSRIFIEKTLYEIESLNPVDDLNVIEMIDKLYVISWSFSLGDIAGICSSFAKKYFRNQQQRSSFLNLRLRLLINAAFRHLSTSELSVLRDDSEVVEYYKDSFQTNIIDETPLRSLDLNQIFFFLNFTDIVKIAEKHVFNSFEINFLQKNTIESQINNSTFKESFKNVIKLITYELTTEITPSYKLLVNEIFIWIELYQTPPSDIIPFNQILEAKPNESNEEYRALILLIDKNFSEVHFQLFSSIIESSNDFSENYYKIFFTILKHAPRNFFIDRALLLLNRKTNINKSELETAMKQYLMSKASTIEI